MDVRAFDFDLPADLIAQEPAADRTAARLLYMHRITGAIAHRSIVDLPQLLDERDVMVVNNTRVFPARLLGHRVPTGGHVECLLLAREDVAPDGAEGVTDPGNSRWEALMHPGQRLGPGAQVVFEGTTTVHGEVLARRFHGRRIIRLWTSDGSPVDDAIDAIGHIPLPPYIKRPERSEDRDRYQTVFARERGSVAAPTAGLHLTRPLLGALAARGVGVVEITLHVGYGTFQPVRVDQVEQHTLEPERYHITAAAATRINQALDQGRRIVAVGTTTTRTLEAVARDNGGRLVAGSGSTRLFIYPGFEFRVIGGLLTNFHLPRSSLLMLVAAFAGREHLLAAYDAAVSERYRFYSYGDAMLIL
jgi:S-adenosylmethionine:tRNA ribosyltransferase-isomerase